MGASAGIEVWSGEVDGEPVSMAKQGSVVVLQGAPDLVAQLVAAEPVLTDSRPVHFGGGAIAGALTNVATAIGPLVKPTGGSPAPPIVEGGRQLFMLDPASEAAFAKNLLAKSKDGGYRLFQKGTGGRIANPGSLTPVTSSTASAGAAQGAATAQTMVTAQVALVMVALMAAIDEVKEAVEQVQATVDLLRDHTEAQQIGQVAGLNAKLRRIADEVALSGALSSVEWDEASSVAAQVDQCLLQVRSFINKRLASAAAEGQSLDGRVDALDHLSQLGEATALLLVAEDNQLLYEQIRLHRIRDVDPERLSRAVEAAAAMVESQRAEDQRLIEQVRQATEERAGVRELEIHRFFSAPKLAANSSRIDELLVTFAERRSLAYTPIELPERPGVGDAARKLRSEGGELASGAAEGGRKLLDAGRSRMRRYKEVASGPEPLESGRVAPALPPGSDEDVILMVDLEKRGDRIRRSIGRRRGKETDEVDR